MKPLSPPPRKEDRAIETREFIGNIKVTISEKEVRVWVCDEKGCQFRFKAVGKVVKSGDMDIMVFPKSSSRDMLLEACRNMTKLAGQITDLELNDIKQIELAEAAITVAEEVEK